ncbi:hypothetical protein B0H14DRAFT_3878670 [Mycena olivaceomarginata]|nr:hypothetical protein B0H14DRAFT_3878670 [Mycena olivaceomarginata]
MFNNSAGHQINGGTFYNVAGDLNLRAHHHLRIQGPELHVPLFPPFSGDRAVPVNDPSFHPGPPPSLRTGTFVTAANVNFYGTKRRREESDDESPSPQPAKRRRKDEEGIEIIQRKDLKLIQEIGSGPGYLVHTGQNKGHAVIVKVFNPGPTVRQQLETTVAFSKGLMHPNILRIEGISSPASVYHFIAYENVHWKNAEGPLAVALKNDLQRSITLGFKMVAGISAGINHLCVRGLSVGAMGPENFDIFLDVDDRFLISINPRSPRGGDDTANLREEDDTSWDIFNSLCQKVLVSANRVLYQEDIIRDPVTEDLLRLSPISENSAATPLSSVGAAPLQNLQKEEPTVPPRREYVWRTIDRGQQSLATIARRIGLDLDMNLSPLRRLTRKDVRSPHRCAGYLREEITLATTMLDSAVVANDTPSPQEICPICHEVVSLHEAFPPAELDALLAVRSRARVALDALLAVRSRARVALAACTAAPASGGGGEGEPSLALLDHELGRDAGEPRRRRKRAEEIGREVDALVGRREKVGLAGLASVPQLVARMILRRRERCVRGLDDGAGRARLKTPSPLRLEGDERHEPPPMELDG